VFADDGWETRGRRTWLKPKGASDEEPSLAAFLVERLLVPESEAASLASEVLGPWVAEWKRRGGQECAHKGERWRKRAYVVLLLIIVLALWGLAALIRLIAT
jgi:hypothetical protein